MNPQDARLVDAVADVNETLDRYLPCAICNNGMVTLNGRHANRLHIAPTDPYYADDKTPEHAPALRFNALRAMGSE